MNGSDGNGIENIARGMSRAYISVARVKFNLHDSPVTIHERKDRFPNQSATDTYLILRKLPQNFLDPPPSGEVK